MTEPFFKFSDLPTLGEHEDLQEVYFSETLSRYLPFSFNKGGSDWQTIRILDRKTNQVLENEEIKRLKFVFVYFIPD